MQPELHTGADDDHAESGAQERSPHELDPGRRHLAGMAEGEAAVAEERELRADHRAEARAEPGRPVGELDDQREQRVVHGGRDGPDQRVAHETLHRALQRQLRPLPRSTTRSLSAWTWATSGSAASVVR